MATAYERSSGLQSAEAVSQESIGRIRLTKRGRVVVSLLVASVVLAVLALLSLWAATGAQASSSEPGVEFAHVIVQPGDSLWSVATSLAPEADTRDVIYDLVRLNHLDSSDVYVGQELAIPLKYAEHGTLAS